MTCTCGLRSTAVCALCQVGHEEETRTSHALTDGDSKEELETPWEKSLVIPKSECLASKTAWGLELGLNRFKGNKRIWLLFPT